MIELLVIWLAGFCIGVAIGIVALWLTSLRCNYRPRRPEQPLAADLIRYTRWRDEQIRRAVNEPIRFDEGRVQRGNGRGGPTTPKPEIVPGFHGPRRTVRWFINNPVQIAECGGPCTIGPTHCDCGALWVDVPRWDEGRTQRGNGSGGPTTPKPNIIPRPQGGTFNPPLTDL